MRSTGERQAGARRLAIACAAALAPVIVPAAGAQTGAGQAATTAAAVPPRLEACYVPASGTVYRIDTPDAPAAGAPKQCLSPAHVRFSWNQQGPAGPAGPQGPEGDPAGLPTNAWGGLKLDNANGFASVGEFGTGNPLGVSGGGTRLLWYPKKSAFRAGRVTGAQWDDANIGWYSFAAGVSATASGVGSAAIGFEPTASGDYSFAAGLGASATGAGATALGFRTIASGTQSTALGMFASTNGHTGAFVIGDASVSTSGLSVRAGYDNQFLARFANGYRLFTDAALTAGVGIGAGGGSWQNLSDVRRKTAFRDVDGEQLLEKLAALPVRTWQYRTQPASVRHMGPTAQDFHAAFSLGESDTTITTIDAAGVGLAAARALEARTRALRAENAALRADVAALRRELAALARLAARASTAGGVAVAPRAPIRSITPSTESVP